MIGLFGGSFDPIHHGHLIVARAVAEALDLEEVRFLPARAQPFKVGRHAAPPEARARLVGLAIAGAPGFRLETIVLDRPGPSYTVDTLRDLTRREPGREFAVLMGTDTARDLPKWREVEVLSRLARFVVFQRTGTPLPELPWPIIPVPVPAIEISATEIRRRVAGGLPIRYWTPDPVVEAIRAERLYLRDVQEPPHEGPRHPV